MDKLYGSLEAGGTKFVCAVGNENFEVVDKIQFKTTTPDETLEQTITFFKKYENLVSLSIGSFGPIDIDHNSKTYGYITNTPKPYWSNTDVVKPLHDALNVPIYFTTDVNSSAYGEKYALSKLNKKADTLVYFTIGTGIGGGVIQNNRFIGGIGHLEMGHFMVSKHPYDIQNNFKGICPFHDGCLEGMAAGPSLKARTGISGENIDPSDPVWDVEAYYLAQAALNVTVSFRPDVIVFGGGVMSNDYMIKKVKDQFLKLLNNYIPIPPIDDYIVTPVVQGNGSATLGNFILAKELIDTY